MEFGYLNCQLSIYCSLQPHPPRAGASSCMLTVSHGLPSRRAEGGMGTSGEVGPCPLLVNQHTLTQQRDKLVTQ